MKVLIWAGCIIALAIIQTAITRAGILLGGIPTMILYGAGIWIASVLCKKVDENNGSNKNQDEQNEMNK